MTDATIEQHECNAKATAKNTTSAAECGVDYIGALGVCTPEVGECMLWAVNPF